MAEIIQLHPPAARKEYVEEDRQFGCRLLFVSDAIEFSYGFEAGLLYARLDARPEVWNTTNHAGNEEMIRRIAAAQGYTVGVEQLSPGWIGVTFTRVEK